MLGLARHVPSWFGSRGLVRRVPSSVGIRLVVSHGCAGSGSVWSGGARRGLVRQSRHGASRRDPVWDVTVRQSRLCEAALGWSRQRIVRYCAAGQSRSGRAGSDRSRRAWAWFGLARSGRSRQSWQGMVRKIPVRRVVVGHGSLGRATLVAAFRVTARSGVATRGTAALVRLGMFGSGSNSARLGIVRLGSRGSARPGRFWRGVARFG